MTLLASAIPFDRAMKSSPAMLSLPAISLNDHAFELFQPRLIICNAVFVSRTIKHSYVKRQTVSYFPQTSSSVRAYFAEIIAEFGFYVFLLFSIEACTSRHFLLDAVECFPRNNRENHRSAELSDRCNSSQLF